MRYLVIIFLLLIPSITQAQELSPPPLNLQIEKPLTLHPKDIVPEGEILQAFTIKQYADILKMFSVYKLWSKNYPIREELDHLWGLRIDNLKEQIELCKQSNEILSKDREFIYDQYLNERKLNNKDNTIKLVGYTSGGVVIGIAIGIIIKTLL
jgi:hypothetical protein